ncbi:fimbrial protein [Serratia marcescens]|nr:fimbrial protein [Serratia marcescens]
MHKLFLICFFSMIFSFFSVRASEQVEMRIRGTLRAPPPCKINDGGVVAVEFGSRIGINKVDGINYRQVISYRITCEPTESVPWTMLLTLKGTATSFDNAALKTDNDSLGIRIYQGDVRFELNSGIKIDPKNPPRLEAVPVAKPSVPLEEGEFTATAMLQADYF